MPFDRLMITECFVHLFCCLDSLPLSAGSLSSVQSPLSLRDNVCSLLDLLCLLGKDQFDVAWIAHVGVDSTVSTIRSSALLWCLVDLDVFDDKV